MTTDRLADLMDIIHAGCIEDWERRFAAGAQAITMHGPDAHHDLAARLAPHVTVGLDVERLAAALLTMAAGNYYTDDRADVPRRDDLDVPWDFGWLGGDDMTPRIAAAAIARAYAATPQPDHSDGCAGNCGTNDHDNPPCPAADQPVEEEGR